MKEELTIKKLQECIKNIDNENRTIDKYMYKLMEEVGELAEAVRKDKKMLDNSIKGTIDEELVDVLYYIVCIANTYNIDIEKCMYLKEEINYKKHNRKNMFED